MTVGGVIFEQVWLDDPRRCTWGVCDLSVELPGGVVVAVVEPEGQGAAEAIAALLAGRRRPVRGIVRFESASRLVAIESSITSGEQRLTVAGGITLVTMPTASSLDEADLVLRFDAGFLAADPVLARAR